MKNGEKCDAQMPVLWRDLAKLPNVMKQTLLLISPVGGCI